MFGGLEEEKKRMPTTSLEETLNVFDPQRPLAIEELDRYYVARPHAPLEPMKTYLRVTKQPVKILFSGHRGSGKSTELTRLAKDLENDFFVVRFSARTLNVSDLNYVDIILACASALFREATEKARHIALPPNVWKGVLDLLTNEITKETTISVPKKGAVSAKVNALIFSIEGKYGRETTTRTLMRERLFPRVNDLIEQINVVCKEIEKETKRRPLIIFEDIDKTDLAHARDLFFDHSTTLTSLACSIIYTFPIPLCYSNQFIERIGDYSRHFLLPNISLYKMDDTPNAEGRDALREVVTRRVAAEAFAGSALEEVISLSGGLLRDLIRLVRDAALIALTEGKPTITSGMTRQVAAEVGNDYRRLLAPEHYDALKKAQQSKQISSDESTRQLLENLSLLEYRNTVTWCDVHPIVRTLLTQRGTA